MSNYDNVTTGCIAPGTVVMGPSGMPSGGYAVPATKVRLNEFNQVTVNSSVARIVLGRRKIHIGCTEIDPEAAQWIMAQWQDRFGEMKEVVLQGA